MAVMLNRKLPGMGFTGHIRRPLHGDTGGHGSGLELDLRPKYGFANMFIGWFGIPAQNWLSSYKLAMPVLAVVNVWQWVGYNMLFFLAGLQGSRPSSWSPRPSTGQPVGSGSRSDPAPVEADNALRPGYDDHRLVPNLRHRLRPD